MDAAPQTSSPRRIGTILVEKQLITDGQLAQALEEQRATGRPLGEICVTRFGLDRLSLADALAEQWAEMQAAAAAEAAAAAAEESEVEEEDDEMGEVELRALLADAQAARLELTVRTEELGRRLAALETLVVGVSSALSELRTSPGASETDEASAEVKAKSAARPRRARTTTRSSTRRAAA